MEGSNGVGGLSETPTPADGDDYTWAPSAGTIKGATWTFHIQDTPSNGSYDLRTGPERAQMQIDDLAGRVRRLEAQAVQVNHDLYGPMPLQKAHERAAQLEDDVRREIRTIAERLQQVEHILDQYAGDHR